MQIISPNFIKQYSNKIINIHHSFLPAFVGAKPYHAAFERGVKIIGATAHYVTDSLDAGPIIDQNIAHVSHRNSVKDLVKIGQDIEKLVLAKAINLHVKRKILVVGNKTIVFN
jgi:formyltetrahydrofolate deformylase